jgi:hypothetical protein
MARLVRHSQRKRGATDRPDLKPTRQTSTLPAGGSSGSPIFAYYPNENDPYRVVGIHNLGFAVENSATRINDVVFASVREWLAESEAAQGNSANSR